MTLALILAIVALIVVTTAIGEPHRWIALVLSVIALLVAVGAWGGVIH